MSISAEQILIERDSGRLISFLGNELRFKLDGSQTAGAFSVIEDVYPPGNFTPPHKHEKTTEIAYILEGELGVMVAEEDYRCGPGSIVIRPKGVPHALWNITDGPVRFLDLYTPAGMEGWFVELMRLTSSTVPPTLEQLFEAGRRFDTVFMPELAPPLIERYGLKLELPGAKS